MGTTVLCGSPWVSVPRPQVQPCPGTPHSPKHLSSPLEAFQSPSRQRPLRLTPKSDPDKSPDSQDAGFIRSPPSAKYSWRRGGRWVTPDTSPSGSPLLSLSPPPTRTPSPLCCWLLFQPPLRGPQGGPEL